MKSSEHKGGYIYYMYDVVGSSTNAAVAEPSSTIVSYGCNGFGGAL